MASAALPRSFTLCRVLDTPVCLLWRTIRHSRTRQGSLQCKSREGNHMFDLSLLFHTPAHPSRTVYFRRNERIFSQGDRSDSLFYIEEGTVKLTVASSGGKEALIGFYDGGHLFGESALAPDLPVRFHNAIALTDLRVLKVDRSAILRLMRSDPNTTHALLAWSLGRNRAVQQELVDQLLDSSEQRLVRILAVLAQYGATDRVGVAPRLTQQDLANMIGLSRQRVNALISRLKKSGDMLQVDTGKRRRAGSKLAKRLNGDSRTRSHGRNP
jgi:CRP/FNR family transcriptional regulator, cyclic AMP receptor protein